MSKELHEIFSIRLAVQKGIPSHEALGALVEAANRLEMHVDCFIDNIYACASPYEDLQRVVDRYAEALRQKERLEKPPTKP